MGWLYATNTTLLAASGAVKMEHCCEDDDTNSGPIETNCAQCVTFGSGLHLGSALADDFLPPVLVVCWELESLIDDMGSARVSAVFEAGAADPPGAVAVCHIVARTALPVRAPSRFV